MGTAPEALVPAYRNHTPDLPDQSPNAHLLDVDVEELSNLLTREVPRTLG